MPLVRTDVEEKSYEGYPADFKHPRRYAPTENVGVRVVHTKRPARSSPVLAGIVPVSIDNDYTDALPSLNAILHLTDTQRLRLGASIAISRPPLDAR